MYGVSHGISYSPDIWFMKNWPRPYSLSPFWGTPQDEPLFIVKPLEVPTEDYQQTNRSPSAAKIAKISCRENIRQKPGSLSLLVLLVKVAEKKLSSILLDLKIGDSLGTRLWSPAVENFVPGCSPSKSHAVAVVLDSCSLMEKTWKVSWDHVISISGQKNWTKRSQKMLHWHHQTKITGSWSYPLFCSFQMHKT